MRVDLFTDGARPWHMRAFLKLLTARVGLVPGPPAVLTYRPDFFHRDLLRYVTRNTSTKSPWGKGNAELFAAFVSNLNTCSF